MPEQPEANPASTPGQAVPPPESRALAGRAAAGGGALLPVAEPQPLADPARRATRVRRDAAGVPGRPSAYPEAVDRLIGEFARLPGIGRRSAERLAFHLLKADEATAMQLAQAVADVKRTVRHCSVCSNLTDRDPCRICSDPGRERHVVLVVEQPKDLIALEQTAMFRGVYHVLMGHISPLDGIGPADLTIPDLLLRIDDPGRNPGHAPIREVIMGLNPTVEGDGTALYLAEELKQRRTPEGEPIRVSRLARGLPTGGSLEFANKAVLADAIQCRQEMQ
jgi:recombination protein RecR